MYSQDVRIIIKDSLLNVKYNQMVKVLNYIRNIQVIVYQTML